MKKNIVPPNNTLEKAYYNEGRRAGKRGKREADCPYIKSSALGKMWLLGRNQGETEITMLTVKELISRLRSFKANNLVYAYEGEITGLVVVNKKGKELGTIDLGEK